MQNNFDSYKDELSSIYNNNNIITNSGIYESDLSYEEQLDVMNNVFPIPDDKEILDNIYNQIGTSSREVSKFDLLSEYKKLISYMKDPEPGTYEYEMYTRQMEVILFWDKYEQKFDKSDDGRRI